MAPAEMLEVMRSWRKALGNGCFSLIPDKPNSKVEARVMYYPLGDFKIPSIHFNK